MANITGRCYCGDIQFNITASPLVRAQCYCRECQYISGGNANLAMTVPTESFHYVTGSPSAYTDPEGKMGVSREFCGRCGTHLLTRNPLMKEVVIVKVGVLDDPAVFTKADLAIFLKDKQPFHHVPDDVPQYDELPG